MTMAAIMPFVPLNPALTKTSEARINVIKVIPDTGFVPTIAIALAATVVNRKEIINTISMATMVWKRLPNTPNWKKMKVVIKVASKTDQNKLHRKIMLCTFCDFFHFPSSPNSFYRQA